MKITNLTLIILLITPFYLSAQDNNVLIGLKSPSFGVKIKANWPNTDSGWARGYHIVNEDDSESFFTLGAHGRVLNGVSSFKYGYIGESYSKTYMSFLSDGHIGVGTTAPQATLDLVATGNNPSMIIRNTYRINSSDPSLNRPFEIRRGTNNKEVLSTHLTDVATFIHYKNDEAANRLCFILSNTDTETGNGVKANSYNVLTLHGNSNGGAVSIGSSNVPGTHKLAVEGSIGARSVKVEASGWSDFVFAKEYDLPSLDSVSSFIQKNGHLPSIPSEEEVLEEGIDLGEMDAKLLQKIEELTLYTIEQEKKIKQLQELLIQQTELIQHLIKQEK